MECTQVQCVLWLAEMQSVKRVQRRFQTDGGIAPPTRDSILHWDKQLQGTGSFVCQTEKWRKPHITQADVDRVQASFVCSPQKSSRKASRQLNTPTSTDHDVVHKQLQLHVLKPDDCPRQRQFTEESLEMIYNDETYLSRIGFSDEATFHVCGKVNRHNCRR